MRLAVTNTFDCSLSSGPLPDVYCCIQNETLTIIGCVVQHASSLNSLPADYVALFCWTTTAMALFQGVGRATFQILRVSLDVHCVVCSCWVVSRKLCPLALFPSHPQILSVHGLEIKIWLGTRSFTVNKLAVQQCRCPVFCLWLWFVEDQWTDVTWQLWSPECSLFHAKHVSKMHLLFAIPLFWLELLTWQIVTHITKI